MYHAYKDGYSVLPQLKKLGEGKPFQITLNDIDLFLEAKRDAVLHQSCFLEHDIPVDVYKIICDYIIANYPAALTEPHDFASLAMQIQEDLIIHRLSDDRDWMAAGHICFPSGWEPLDKIGRPFSEIHAPVPGMNLAMSRKMAEAMVYHGPFERFVWSVVFEDRINFHPRFEKRKFDPQNPVVYVKVERQVSVGFPEQGAALFILRQHLIKDGIDKIALANSLKMMTPEQREYKGVSEFFDDLVSYLLTTEHPHTQD